MMLRPIRFVFLVSLVLLLSGGSAVPLDIAPVPAAFANGDDDNGNGGDDGENGGENGKDDEDDNGDRDDDEDDEDGEGNGQVESAADYRVDVECVFDDDADESTCTFIGVAPPDAKDVSHVDLPAEEVCGEVVGGDHEFVDPDPNTRVVGYKSRGSEGTFTLIIAGEVTTGGMATYWFKTGDGVFPASGQGLQCDDDAGEAELRVTVVTLPTIEVDIDISGDSAIVVETFSCGQEPDDPESFDWFGACEPGVEGVNLALKIWEGTQRTDIGDGVTDASGVLTFDSLATGTYDLDSVDAKWCHAESDSVDEGGKLVVKSGQRVTVWIFFCGEGAK